MNVTAFRLIAGGGNLRACASVQIGQVIIHDFRVVQQPGQRAYVQAPVRSYLDKNGKQQYSGALVELPSQTMQTVSAKVLEHYRQETAK